MNISKQKYILASLRDWQCEQRNARSVFGLSEVPKKVGARILFQLAQRFADGANAGM
jgi:hypothetical protein